MVWAELMSQINIFPIASGVARVGNLVVVRLLAAGCDSCVEIRLRHKMREVPRENTCDPTLEV